jgi:hypothetical protein
MPSWQGDSLKDHGIAFAYLKIKLEPTINP